MGSFGVLFEKTTGQASRARMRCMIGLLELPCHAPWTPLALAGSLTCHQALATQTVPF